MIDIICRLSITKQVLHLYIFLYYKRVIFFLNNKINKSGLNFEVLLKKDCASDGNRTCIHFFSIKGDEMSKVHFGYGGGVDSVWFELLI